MILHSFFRSSAAWRVRIALHLKGLDYQVAAHNFRTDAQRAPDYLALNPQGLVPALTVEETTLTQSLAIIEYLEEAYPSPPLLPRETMTRAKVRAMALLIACDIHPLNNLRILNALRQDMGRSDEEVAAWYCRWVEEGFAALEALAKASGDGRRCFGSMTTLADIFLVPQMYNARRFDVNLAAYPRLCSIDETLRALPAFAETAPEKQPDSV